MLNIKLKVGNIFIRRFCNDDLPSITPIFMQDDIMYYYVTDDVKFKSEDKIGQYIEDWDDNETSFMFSCFKNDDLVAVFTLDDYSSIQKRTECGIALTNPKYYGQGLAKKIVTIMLDYLFHEKRLHKVYISYIDGNESSYHLFKSLGFQEDGRFREHIRRKTEYLDLYYMSLLNKEWQG
ncbi:MAG: GNAT family N-acetyltransferase [Clostridiaceae bacterium]|nr:GNAT family N-acetyltransferase [Clostridiaceae bacterium]